MAVKVDVASSTVNVADVNSLTWSHTCTGADRALCATTGNSDATAKVTDSITYAAVSMTEAWDLVSGILGCAGYYLANPATGANNVVATLNSASAEFCAGAVSFTGVNQTNPVGVAVSASGTSTTPSVTVSSQPGAIVVDMVYASVASIAVANIYQTSQWERENIRAATVSGGSSTKNGAALTTMSWTITSAAWRIGAISFNPIFTVRNLGSNLRPRMFGPGLAR